MPNVKPNDEQLIRDLIALWMTASAKGDLQTVLTLMDEDVVFLIPGQPPMRGRDAFAASFLKMPLDQFRLESTSEIQEIQISRLGLLLESSNGEYHAGWFSEYGLRCYIESATSNVEPKSASAAQWLHAFDLAQEGRQVGALPRRQPAVTRCADIKVV